MTFERVRPYVAPVVDAAPPDVVKTEPETLICRRCHKKVAWTSFEVCTWWPNGCTSIPGTEPRPQVCWDCCDEDQRIDLVDARCIQAAYKIRSGR